MIERPVANAVRQPSWQSGSGASVAVSVDFEGMARSSCFGRVVVSGDVGATPTRIPLVPPALLSMLSADGRKLLRVNRANWSAVRHSCKCATGAAALTLAAGRARSKTRHDRRPHISWSAKAKSDAHPAGRLPDDHRRFRLRA
jgi:hypothetical protein